MKSVLNFVKHIKSEINNCETLESLKLLMKTDLKYLISRVKYDSNKYKRTVIYKNDKFEVVLIGWMPHQSTPFHYHPNKGCIFKILQGNLMEVLQKKTEKFYNLNFYKTDDVGYIHNDIGCHAVENFTNEKVISLHIYPID